MTSGEFTSFAIDGITIDREARQRRSLTNVNELAESISRAGLIHPPVIERDGRLVTGERRIEACKLLGWTHVPVQFADELSDLERHILELEENVRRVNLSWQEECEAVHKYHDLRASLDEDWSHEKTGEALGLSRPEVTEKLAVADELESGNERVQKADTYTTARKIVSRAAERKQQSALADLEKDITGEEPTIEVPLLNADFIEWASSYDGAKFNFIHCDFPYGVGTKEQGQGAGKVHGAYADTEDVYWELLNAFRDNMDKFVAESAHLMFWFSMDYYQQTLDALKEMGWHVNPFPLIWHKSDNTGILPDASRGPRRIYETCLFASRGDRKIVQAVGNCKAHGVEEERIHASEKPREVLKHFMRMIVDEYSVMLDPTCGSGNAVRVAEMLGAHSVLGLEKDGEFYERAKDRYY